MYKTGDEIVNLLDILHIWVPGYTFWVPWFHPIFLGWNLGTMEPRFQATHFWFHGSMVPPKNSMSKIKNFVGWNHGTMEPRFQATHLRFHGSMVPPNFFRVEPWNYGTLVPGYTFEVPWNPNVYYVY